MSRVTEYRAGLDAEPRTRSMINETASLHLTATVKWIEYCHLLEFFHQNGSVSWIIRVLDMGELDYTDSELDELSSDEEYVEKPAKGKATTAKAKQHSDGYTISGVLKAPRAVNYSCTSIHGICYLLTAWPNGTHAYPAQILEEQIDLNPDYQRSVVWPDVKQVGLIDSIIRNYYVPVGGIFHSQKL